MRKWIMAILLAFTCIASADHFYMPHQVHVMVGRAIDGSSLEIEDGSVFSVVHGQEYILLNWASSDPITISINQSLFGSGKYCITNKMTGSYLNVDLKLGPLINNGYTKRIIGIDYYYGELLLEDGGGRRSSWLVDEADLYLIRDFVINQAIIVGENTGRSSWFSSSDSILINVERNRSVRAREY